MFLLVFTDISKNSWCYKLDWEYYNKQSKYLIVNKSRRIIRKTLKTYILGKTTKRILTKIHNFPKQILTLYKSFKRDIGEIFAFDDCRKMFALLYRKDGPQNPFRDSDRH